MNRCGIITFHFENNYGAVLQAYALYKKIESLGYECEIIDFKSQKMIDNNKEKLSLKGFIKFCLSFFWIISEKNKFKDFRKKYMKLSNRTFYSTEQLEEQDLNYDILISGSDQIWNQDIVFERALYLDIKGCEKTKKISYASSFGKEEINEEYKKEIFKYLKKFTSIAVREDKSKYILEHNLNIQVEHVLDPIFLLPLEYWRQIKKSYKNNKMKDGYILIYTMETNNLMLKIGEQLSNYFEVPICFLSVGTPGIKQVVLNQFSRNQVLGNVGPREFIDIIDNATCVVTNSFHGVAFSVLLETPFLNIAHSRRNLRMESLLRVLNLEEKVIKENENFKLQTILDKLNLKPDKEVLDKEIKKSQLYLKKALS